MANFFLWPTEERRDDIFAFVICLCAIICTALLIKITIQKAVQEPTVQAAQANERATNATIVAAKAEHNIKQVTQQVQQTKNEVQQVRTEAQQATVAAKRVKIHDLKGCNNQINMTNTEVMRLSAKIDSLEKEVRILEGK